METLAKRLVRLRKERELSVSAVAQKIGVSTSTYREWEYGRKIRGEPYAQLAQVFDISLSELLLGKNASVGKVVKKLELTERILREVRQLL